MKFILNASGRPVVKYEYDMFGKPSAFVSVNVSAGYKWYATTANIRFEDQTLQKKLWGNLCEVAKVNPVPLEELLL